MTRDASRMSQGMLYIHLAPTDVFAAVGFYGFGSGGVDGDPERDRRGPEGVDADRKDG